MRIVCPSCAATYDVPDTMLGAGRAVRCAKCGGKWLPTVEPEPIPGPAAATDVTRSGGSHDFESPPPRPRASAPIEGAFTRLADAPLARPMPRPPGRGMVLTLLGWLATIVMLGGVGWAGVVWRAEVMRHWPPSERVYAALGLDR